MLLIVHADKTVTTIAENLNIGDTAADIYVISPFPSTQSCSLLYRLPSGEEGEPTFAQGTALGGDYEGAVYSFEIPSAFTKEVGSVQVMVSFVDTKGRRFVSDEVTFDVGGFVTLPFPDSEEQGADFSAQLEALATSIAKLTTAYENVSGVVNIIPSDQTDSVDISVNLNGPQTGILFTFNLTQANMQSIAASLVSEHNEDEEAHPFILGEIDDLKEDIGSTENIMKMLDGIPFGASIPGENPKIGDFIMVGTVPYVYAKVYDVMGNQSTKWQRLDEVAFSAISQTYLSLNNQVGINRKRITNLEQGMPADSFLTDSTVAYTKEIPGNACQYALVSHLDESVTALKVRGTNCIPYPYYAESQERSGIKYTTDANGRVFCEGTASGSSSYFVFQSSAKTVHLSGTYFVSGLVAGTTLQLRKEPEQTNISFNMAETQKSVPEGDYSVRLFVQGGTTINATLAIMLNKVSATLPFSPYKVTEVAASDIATDNYIEVDGGGIITFENPTSAPVASTIVYQLRGE